jgi:hypothetical protein
MHWVGYDQVFMQGSITQEINVNRLSNYKELGQEIACMFDIEGQDDGDLEYRLMYKNNKDYCILVGKSPWEYVTLPFSKNSTYCSSRFGLIILP